MSSIVARLRARYQHLRTGSKKRKGESSGAAGSFAIRIFMQTSALARRYRFLKPARRARSVPDTVPRMPDFRIWGTIHQVVPREFAVTVSAVPDDPASGQGAVVEAITVSSRELAVEACADLVLRMGKLVRERGDRVVDVEEA